MSQENVEVVRRVYEAIAAHDSDTLGRLYDPDIAWDNSRGVYGDLVAVGVYRGLDEVRRGFGEWFDAWDRIEFDCSELIEADERVVSVVTFRGRGRHSAIDVEVTTAGVWTIDRGSVVHTEWFHNKAEALEAAGLQE